MRRAVTAAAEQSSALQWREAWPLPHPHHAHHARTHACVAAAARPMPRLACVRAGLRACKPEPGRENSDSPAAAWCRCACRGARAARPSRRHGVMFAGGHQHTHHPCNGGASPMPQSSHVRLREACCACSSAWRCWRTHGTSVTRVSAHCMRREQVARLLDPGHRPKQHAMPAHTRHAGAAHDALHAGRALAPCAALHARAPCAETKKNALHKSAPPRRAAPPRSP